MQIPESTIRIEDQIGGLSECYTSRIASLFLGGIMLGYLTLPKGLEILIGFNPEGIVNIVEFSEYLQFFTRTLLVFGIAFEIPVFLPEQAALRAPPRVCSVKGWYDRERAPKRSHLTRKTQGYVFL